MSTLGCEQNFIRIGQELAEIQLSNGFQHGGGGHFGKWRRTSSVGFFTLSMSISNCASTFIRIGQELAEIQPSRGYQHGGGGGHIENGVEPSALSFFDSACQCLSVYQLS
jgi:hypothetical protein